jgi:hypothetical protein
VAAARLEPTGEEASIVSSANNGILTVPTGLATEESALEVCLSKPASSLPQAAKTVTEQKSSTKTTKLKTLVTVRMRR